MNMFSNGIVIQAIIDSEYFAHRFMPECGVKNDNYYSYLGISRFLSWPLQQKGDNVSKELTNEGRERWFDYWYDQKEQKFALEIVPDIDYCMRYLRMCDEQKINTRILFCKTNRDVPRWEERVPDTVSLGYDYGTPQGFYSTIPDDLLQDEIAIPLVQYRNKLNSYKLFDDITELDSYILARNKLIESGLNLERDLDFCKFNLSIINRNPLLSML